MEEHKVEEHKTQVKSLPVLLCSCALVLLLAVTEVYAIGLGELMSIARAQKDAQKAYSDETKAFEKVKSAVDKGSIKKGDPKKSIGDRYGEPVVSIIDSNTKREKWIYKPASSSFFAGVKVYLYFDKDDKLDEVKIVE